MVWNMVMVKEKIRQRVKVCFIFPAGAAATEWKAFHKSQ